MNKIVLLPLVASLTGLTFSFSAAAEGLTGCAAKRASIENQIRYARKHNNIDQISGLQAALNKNEHHCTDAGLLLERQHKVAEKQRKVAEREQELALAGETGDQKKIRQKEKKLKQAKEELAKAQSELAR
ncbi:DUF1090 domain-containing protein [Salmonella enterica]|nr:DUF1090 domain-containing protein [Salmonella enterica]EBA9765555.1 DUF1090 domain-containing protein [Salmonella enterica]EEB5699308.1 DUF1090 family protein [Salmonella enterica]EGX5144508.1 DUF1090 domain-containing protein [Salmonella enterica]ELF4900219.1 DUF1090 domain-containing protein [Salmonella enterica]